MIRPISPVRLSDVAVLCRLWNLYSPRFALPDWQLSACRDAGWLWVDAARQRWLHSASLPLAFAGPPRSEAECVRVVSPQLAESDADGRALASPETQWQPWPAHGPYAHEAVRWWPSDLPPPVSPPVLTPQPLTVLVETSPRGGLLDTRI
jgi:hypothetical protein